jgi:prophage maintenance system killer protein
MSTETNNTDENRTLVVFKPDQGGNEYQVILDSEADTVWATEQQISDVFDRDRTVIGRHIRNIFKEDELNKNSVCAKFAHTAEDGKTYQVNHYNLDVIISVGYRVKSNLATEFRKWATSKLKDYLLKGYALNKELLQSKTEQIKSLEVQIDYLNETAFQNQKQITEGFLSIIRHYSKSFELLNKYDTEELSTEGLNEDVIYTINYEDVKKAIQELKQILILKGEASEVFGNEKDKSFEGILGSISQTVFGELAYPTIEEQAAQLLYSIIKGHAFTDGNKRIGSFVFVWFLEQNNFHKNLEGKRKIDDNTLVALALAVAQSLPEQRELITKLIINLVKN